MRSVFFTLVLGFIFTVGSSQKDSLSIMWQEYGDGNISLQQLIRWKLTDTTAQSSDTMCIERGHVIGDGAWTTLMYCPPYLIETDTSTILVYPGCNYNSFDCLRCGKYVEEKEKERREVIWKKDSK